MAPTTLTGAVTTWPQAVAVDQVQVRDNDYLWEILFVTGHQPSARPVSFAGNPGVDPVDLWSYLLNKQQDADTLASALPVDAPATARCVFCRHQFGTRYHDAFFGDIEIRRNARNRNYCNQCDYFIRICPGQATLTLPVLVADVKDSREIRRHVANLRVYSRLLQRFHRTIVHEVQRNYGFVINTIGDAVVAVWPSGFTPQWMRERLSWDEKHPAKIAAKCAIDTAEALVQIAPQEFDGSNLPFRGALDTTEMCVFAVTDTEAEEAEGPGRDGSDSQEIGETPLGPTAVDVAGEAVEVASHFSSHPATSAGRMYISQRTDEVARTAREHHYTSIDGASVASRVI